MRSSSVGRTAPRKDMDVILVLYNLPLGSVVDTFEKFHCKYNKWRDEHTQQLHAKMVDIRETQTTPTNVLRQYNVNPTQFLTDMPVMTHVWGEQSCHLRGFNMPAMPPIPPFQPPSYVVGSSSQTGHPGDDDDNDAVVDLQSIGELVQIRAKSFASTLTHRQNVDKDTSAGTKLSAMNLCRQFNSPFANSNVWGEKLSTIGSDPVKDPQYYRCLVGTESHWKTMNRILRYLTGTLDYGLTLQKSNSLDLVGFRDDDWAPDMDD
uniref:Uncharacterized protein n=1 Tax=Cannabis sativa TaxID=3483 RepID=A0A803NIV1_CANSA